jgi:uncharacterized protein YacL (UPF0231 family)
MSENGFTPDTERVRKMYATYYDKNSSNFVHRWAEFNRWLAEYEIEVRADQIERDAKVVEAGGRYWDAELVHFRHLYPAEIATELRSQKIAHIEEEN